MQPLPPLRADATIAARCDGGRPLWRRRLAIAARRLGLLSMLLPGIPQAASFDIARLSALLSATPAGAAAFTESRHAMVNGRPLVFQSSGRLWFKAPDTFVRETLAPRAETLAVTGNRLTMRQGGRSRSIALDSAPEAGVIVEAIRGTLTGNRAALERQFDTAVAGDASAWTLELTPRDPRLREQVAAAVRISGRQGVVREVLLTLPDGDRSVMTITPLAPAAAAALIDGASGADAAAAVPVR